ncbi:MAG: hypothetical protein ACLFU6_06155 [Candidatus Hydrogenedentota bacterium]
MRGLRARLDWRTVLAVGLGVSLLASMGCATVDRNMAVAKQTVTPLTTGDAADLPAEVLAEAMLRAGFGREAILEHGPAIRNALATGGSAQVTEGPIVDALFAVHGQQLYVTSRTRGTFVQRLNPGEDRETPPEPLRPPVEP